MITGRLVRGVFTRIGAYGASGAKALLRAAPKEIMQVSSIRMGRIAGNMRKTLYPDWKGPGLSALRHLQQIGSFGMNTASKYSPGVPWVGFYKNHGLQANHASTEGLSLALFRGRHTNLI